MRGVPRTVVIGGDGEEGVRLVTRCSTYSHYSRKVIVRDLQYSWSVPFQCHSFTHAMTRTPPKAKIACGCCNCREATAWLCSRVLAKKINRDLFLTIVALQNDGDEALTSIMTSSTSTCRYILGATQYIVWHSVAASNHPAKYYIGNPTILCAFCVLVRASEPQHEDNVIDI